MATWFSEGMRRAQRAAEDAARRRAELEREARARDELVEAGREVVGERDGKA